MGLSTRCSVNSHHFHNNVFAQIIPETIPSNLKVCARGNAINENYIAYAYFSDCCKCDLKVEPILAIERWVFQGWNGQRVSKEVHSISKYPMLVEAFDNYQKQGLVSQNVSLQQS